MDKFSIRSSDNILVYWGTQGVRPLRVEVAPAEVSVNESFTVSVKYLNDNDLAWVPLPNATVHVNPDYLTDSEGSVSVRLPRSGVYNIYAERWGDSAEDQFIRSDTVQVGVGVPIPEFHLQAVPFTFAALIVAVFAVLNTRKRR